MNRLSFLKTLGLSGLSIFGVKVSAKTVKKRERGIFTRADGEDNSAVVVTQWLDAEKKYQMSSCLMERQDAKRVVQGSRPSTYYCSVDEIPEGAWNRAVIGGKKYPDETVLIIEIMGVAFSAFLSRGSLFLVPERLRKRVSLNIMSRPFLSSHNYVTGCEQYCLTGPEPLKLALAS